MVQGALRDVVVVGGEMVLQCRFEFGRARESSLPDEVGDAAVEALDQAVGLRMAGQAQAVLDSERAQVRSNTWRPVGVPDLLVKRSVNWLPLSRRASR